MLESNNLIKGYKTKYGKEIKASMVYAYLIIRKESSIGNLFESYNTYAQASEAK